MNKPFKRNGAIVTEEESARERRTVGHAQDSRPGVLELKVLVSELGTVDALASRPVVVGEIPLQQRTC